MKLYIKKKLANKTMIFHLRHGE